MKLIVNGEERLHVDGKFGRVSGEAAIGPAFRSKVTVQSFHVQGVEVDPAPPKPKPLLFEFDECHIAVPQDRHQEAVDWYCRFLRMDVQRNSRISPIHETLQGTLLEFRQGKGTIGLVSSPEEKGHFGVDWGKMDGARFVLRTGNLQATRHFLIQQGVRTTPIVTGISGLERFDFFDPFGTRLTVMKDEWLDMTIAGTVGFTVPIVTVSNVERSREWYAKYLGMRRNTRRSRQGADLMMGLWRFNGVREPAVWLEEQNTEDKLHTHVNTATRMYYYVESYRFMQSYQRWKAAGIEVSDIAGRAYHVYDPDGNRINIFTC
jgi:catechol 2,3-dioxygenase-like lactoylglutathione lyase family enzyme